MTPAEALRAAQNDQVEYRGRKGKIVGVAPSLTIVAGLTSYSFTVEVDGDVREVPASELILLPKP